jgi:hypothetical protein
VWLRCGYGVVTVWLRCGYGVVTVFRFFRFSGEGAWYMYQSQGIASLSDRTLGSIDPSQCVLLCPLN